MSTSARFSSVVKRFQQNISVTLRSMKTTATSQQKKAAKRRGYSGKSDSQSDVSSGAEPVSLDPGSSPGRQAGRLPRRCARASGRPHPSFRPNRRTRGAAKFVSSRTERGTIGFYRRAYSLSQGNARQPFEPGPPIDAEGKDVSPAIFAVEVDHLAGMLEDRLPFGAGSARPQPAQRDEVDTFFIGKFANQLFQALARRGAENPREVFEVDVSGLID